MDLGDLAVLNGLMRRQELPAGARLMASDTHGDSAYVIPHGAVKVHVEQEDGRDVIVAILGPGEIVGEMSVIDREAFHTCLRTMPRLTLILTEILSKRLRIANERIKALATLARLCPYGAGLKQRRPGYR